MKKGLTLLFATVHFFQAFAQTDSLKWVKEINEQVWKPFVTSFTSGNNEGFKALHSKRITRVIVDDNVIKDFDKYFPPAQNKPNPTAIGSTNNNTQRLFELRFDKRIANGNKAWETGYYKGTVAEPGKEARVYYGRFFVVLEKENGIWKIIVDADTGKEATRENFEAAAPME
jgi:hypothetical protein